MSEDKKTDIQPKDNVNSQGLVTKLCESIANVSKDITHTYAELDNKERFSKETLTPIRKQIDLFAKTLNLTFFLQDKIENIEHSKTLEKDNLIRASENFIKNR